MGVGTGPGRLIRGAIYEQRFDNQVAELRRRYPNVDTVVEVVEWELARAPDFSKYPVIESAGPFGVIRATKTERAGKLPAMVILFSVAADDQKFSFFAATLANDLD